MNTTYQPQKIESAAYDHWLSLNSFQPHGRQDTPAYAIVIPPPNVTGSLHMGHGFQHTLMDILIRYHRMLGDNTLWQMGTDHAGIATQMLVEKQLRQQKGIHSRHDIGRSELIKHIWAWKEKSGNTIGSQMRRLGVSGDWETERFTMDEGCSKAVIHAFITLYRQGLIYKGKKLVNWDPVLHTAISDLEVNNQEEQGLLYYLRFPLVKGETQTGKNHVVIATTRPETLLGDVACAVHPDDKRYQHLIGQQIRLPLTERCIPIVADAHVKPEFGTGIVKITPAHDFNDYAIAQRHDLPLINILTPNARLNEQVPTPYQGLDCLEARKRIISDLTDQGLVEKTQPHTLSVPRGDRSGAVIEPYLTDQWFLKMKPLAKKAIEAAKTGELRFHPENWLNTYLRWLESIDDWCISRQLWWGHRIPVWEDKASGQRYVGHNEAEVRQTHQLSEKVELHQDEDVLDTWFSSALWPFASLGWPETNERLTAFYPNNVLVTGFDIIFFWVARMVMMGLHLTDTLPFKDVYITGLIRDSQGQKMSKSKGNVLDPIDLVDGIDLASLLKKRTQHLMQDKHAKNIETQTRKDFPSGIQAHGSDALRFTFCALASTGRDIKFDISRLEGYRNFCNKLWNAARYVMNLSDITLDYPIPCPATASLHFVDRWIIHELQTVIQDAHHAIDQYRFDWLAKRLYEFTWHIYCDWYLELTKYILSKDAGIDATTQKHTQTTLIYVLDTLLRLLHPIIPYITESLWQNLLKQKTTLEDATTLTLALAAYPQPDARLKDKQAATEMQWIQSIITAIRTLRAEMNITPGKSVPLIIDQGDATDYQRLDTHKNLLIQQLKLSTLKVDSSNDSPLPPSATVLVGPLRLNMPMQGLIDKDSEITRLEKALNKITKELSSLTNRLNNPNYVKKAPPEIVEQVKTHVTALKTQQNKYENQLETITRLSE